MAQLMIPTNVNGHNTMTDVNKSARIQELTKQLYNNSVILAPMVRANSLPFRLLCLEQGVHTVHSEEIIDRKLVNCRRVVNCALGTVDFIVDKTVLFQTFPAMERGSLVLQLGTSTPESALKAARLVEQDVSGIDINMGCPKKFSIQAGMGAALLGTVDLACSIVSTLRAHLSIPVSAKIRLLDPSPVAMAATAGDGDGDGATAGDAERRASVVDNTADFIIALIKAGVCAVTVHCRTRYVSSSESLAQYELLAPVIAKVRAYEAATTSAASTAPIPIISNGDHYGCADVARHVEQSGCNGVMLGRPLLLNASLAAPLRAWFDQRRANSSSSGTNDSLSAVRTRGMLSQTQVIKAYLPLCLRFKPPFVVVKYGLQEMTVFRRHPPSKLRSVVELGAIDADGINPTSGLPLSKNKRFDKISAAKTMRDLCLVFELESEYDASLITKADPVESSAVVVVAAAAAAAAAIPVGSKRVLAMVTETKKRLREDGFHNSVPAHKFDDAYFAETITATTTAPTPTLANSDTGGDGSNSA